VTVLTPGVHALILIALGATTTESQHETWDLATADTGIAVGVSGNHPIVARLENPHTRHDWAGQAMGVPLMAKVWVGPRELMADWAFQQGVKDDQTGRLTLAFASAHPKLSLKSVWRARPGRGPIEHWIEIENQSGERVTIPHQDSLSLRGLSPSGPATLWWIKRGGGNASTQGGTFSQPLDPKLNLVLASNCEDGASPVPWMAVQVGEAEGLYVGWEFSGLGRIHARPGKEPGTLDIDIGNHPDFKTDIEPGETFFVPPAFVGCYAGDLDEGSHSLHRFIIEKLRPPLPRDCPDPILAYNLYLDVGGNNAREADVLRSAKTCRELGFEAFMPDAMWFPETGDWRWDPKRFPSGVKPIEEFVHASGMKLALWCAWTNGGLSAHPEALSVRARPDWFNADYGPDWKPGPFYGGHLCLGCPEARDWAIKKTQWLVGHHKLDYLKHDIDPISTRCNKTTHRHRYGVDASYWAATGYYEVQERLRNAFPRLILENCSGGGHIKDFGIIQRTHYTVTTDTLSNLPNRQSIYDSAFAFPPLILQAYTYDNYYPVKGDNPGTFLWRTAMMGAWQIDPTDTPKWTDEERESARRSALVYKEWVRPILQDAKVHHILPRPDGKQWDGMFHWSPSLEKGTLYIFRPESEESAKTVKLKGLEPQGQYWLWSEDGSIAPAQRTGEELMQAGLAIALPGQYTSDLIFVQDASHGKPKDLVAPGEFRLKGATVESTPFEVVARLSWEPSANARLYRILVSESPDFAAIAAEASCTSPPVSIPRVPPGRKLLWKVEAISRGGRLWNADGPASFTTPKLQGLEGIAFASDMQWVKAMAGADNPVRRDRNYYAKPIAIAGKTYPKGLWTHSFNDATPADVVFDISGKKLAALRAEVGLDDMSGGGSVQFQVFVDGKLKAESPVLRPRAVHKLDVDVTGAREITLRVLNGGDGYSCDHAAWGLARFLAPGARDPLQPN
jgi:alpha-galactosidase